MRCDNNPGFCFISLLGDDGMGELKLFLGAESKNTEGGVCLWAVPAFASSCG